VNERIAQRVGSHLATLLRWRFARLTNYPSELQVLTATRIGRDISTRTPIASPATHFVYHDYHVIRSEKPRIRKYLANKPVVIVVDIVTTGVQVGYLIDLCREASASVIGVVSFIDFSEGMRNEVYKFEVGGKPIEHLTFVREPLKLSDQQAGDVPVDPYT